MRNKPCSVRFSGDRTVNLGEVYPNSPFSCKAPLELAEFDGRALSRIGGIVLQPGGVGDYVVVWFGDVVSYDVLKGNETIRLESFTYHNEMAVEFRY